MAERMFFIKNGNLSEVNDFLYSQRDGKVTHIEAVSPHVSVSAGGGYTSTKSITTDVFAYVVVSYSL